MKQYNLFEDEENPSFFQNRDFLTKSGTNHRYIIKLTLHFYLKLIYIMQVSDGVIDILANFFYFSLTILLFFTNLYKEA